MAACNITRGLKTLSELDPYEYIVKIWTSVPDRFIVDPIHQMRGPKHLVCTTLPYGRTISEIAVLEHGRPKLFHSQRRNLAGS